MTEATLCARALRRAPPLQETAGLSDAEVDRAVVAAEGDLDMAVAALHKRQHPPAPTAHAANGGARLRGMMYVWQARSRLSCGWPVCVCADG